MFLVSSEVMEATTTRILNFIKQHADVIVRRVDAQGIWLASPGVQIDGTNYYQCTMIDGPYKTFSEVRAALGY
jgi:hypothetical protein